MNNNDRFNELFIEFEEETKKKVKNKYLTLEKCIEELKNKRYNPYLREESFIDFCRKIRNIKFHGTNDHYFLITDDTIQKLEDIVNEVKHPFKIEHKATKNVFSANLHSNVRKIMREMDEKSYTHIPIYSDSSEKELVGVFSENSIFQSLIQKQTIEVRDSTTFEDIRTCIDLRNTKEVIKFVSRDKLYDDVVNDFIQEFKDKKKLSCVMVTHHGTSKERVIGILTSWDVIGR